MTFLPQPLGTGAVAGIAGLAGIIGTFALRLFDRVLARSANKAKLSLVELRTEQTRQEAQFNRMEKEISRLQERGNKLEHTVSDLERELAKEREDHAETRRWCNHLELTLRLMGKNPGRDFGPREK